MTETKATNLCAIIHRFQNIRCPSHAIVLDGNNCTRSNKFCTFISIFSYIITNEIKEMNKNRKRKVLRCYINMRYKAWFIRISIDKITDDEE